MIPPYADKLGSLENPGLEPCEYTDADADPDAADPDKLGSGEILVVFV